MRSLGTLLLVMALQLAGARAAGDRVLRAEPEAERQLRQVPATVLRAVGAAHPECSAEQLRRRSPGAYICQIRALTAAAEGIEVPARAAPPRNRALRRRTQLAAAALRLGLAVEDFTPVNPIAGLPEQRFRARALGCEPLISLYDDLVALPPGSPAATALQGLPDLEPPQPTRPLKDVVCACLGRAGQLAEGAFLPPRDPLVAEVQGAQYRRGCFLDVEAGSTTLLELRRNGPSAFPEPSHAPGAPSRAELVRRQATNRDFQLRRCRDRLGDRRPDEQTRARLEACVCEVASRWRFPKDPGRSDEVELPLVPGRARYVLTVGPTGSVDACRVVLEQTGDRGPETDG